MTIEVILFHGRSLDAKRRLYRDICSELHPFGVEPGDVKITLIEPTRENWGLRGLPASEIELGFDVDV